MGGVGLSTDDVAAAGTGTRLQPVDADRVAAARDRLMSADDAARLASLLSLLADPVRSRILYALDTVDELCVGDLALVLDASEDTVSYALRILRTAGLVTGRRRGRMIFYRLADDFPAPLREHCLRRLVELSRRADDPFADNG
jgi:ArsR family transcriptional regulator, lead/cadmium/zinc/bismuth-responsive transcriptional repressor